MPTNIQAEWFGGPKADLGDEITQSLRFNSNGYLTRAQSAPLLNTDRTFTFSTWFKHGDMQETQIFGIHLVGSNNNWLLAYTGGTSYDSFLSRDYTGWQHYDSDQKFRDPNAWYHIFLTCSSGVLTMRVNNAPRGGTVTQNHSMDRDFYIGSEQGGSTAMDGYLAETYFIQGTVLDAVNDGFIRLNEDGVYVPSTPTISSYGTNGFYLKYDPNGVPGGTGDGAGVGADHSGNGNHFSALGFDTTAISSSNFDNDIDYNDTPTNNTATLNPLVRSYNTISEGNLKWDQSSANDQYFSVASMRMDQPTYGEMTALENTNAQYPSWGICNEFKAVNVYQGYDVGGVGIATDTNSAHCCRDGSKRIKGVYTSPANNPGAPTWVAGDIVRWTFNPNNGECRVAVNGGSFFTWHTFSTSEVEDEGYKYFCAAACNTSGQVNFGNRPFVYSIPTGFSALQTNNLAAPTIKNGSDHFRALTGTGANILAIAQGTNTSGTNWNPDVDTGFTNGLWWIKDRDNSSTQNQLVDSVRGSNLALTCPTTGSDQAYSAPSGNSVAWCWNAGSAAVSNTDGTITSSVSANTDAGFSIVTYTGTGSNATIGHGLTEIPEIVFYKRRNGTDGWVVYSAELAATEYLQLHNFNAKQTGSPTMFNSLRPTNSLLNVGTNTSTNASGGSATYVAYCWHSVEGYSKFGSYTGNGNADGPFVYLGFRPAFILTKATGASENWRIHDSTRDVSNPAISTLSPNVTSEENVNSLWSIDILSNGFKIRTSTNNFNTNGGNYIYAAFAENPFGGENQPPATAR